MCEDSWAFKMGSLTEYAAESLQEYDQEYSPRLLELENRLYSMMTPQMRELFEEYAELSVREAATRANIYFSHGYHAGIKDAPRGSYNERLNKHLVNAEQA